MFDLCHGLNDQNIFLFFFSARYYPWIDLTKPSAFSLNGVNVYEQTEPNVTVGLWYEDIFRIFKYCFSLLRYIVPSDIEVDHSLPTLGDHLKRYVTSVDQPIIIYLHGQDGTR